MPLGLALAVAMGFALYVNRLIANHTIWRLGFALLIAGLVATLSRGPWVGAAVTLLIFLALSNSPGVKFTKLGLLAIPVFAALLVSPWGNKIIELLPFIGEVDEHNVTYRADFTRISIAYILENPLFGDPYFNDAAVMEELKPQGLLDTLNIFIAVGLSSGLTGMFLFVASSFQPAVRFFEP